MCTNGLVRGIQKKALKWVMMTMTMSVIMLLMMLMFARLLIHSLLFACLLVWFVFITETVRPEQKQQQKTEKKENENIRPVR